MDRDKSLRQVGYLAGVCLLLAGCAGTLDDPDRFRTLLGGGNDTEGGGGDDGGEAGSGCGDVPSTIFVKSCATSTCHSTADKVQKLDLEAPGVAARVVGVPATGTTCSGVLADPANPEKSVLYLRLVGTTCGARMPFASVNPLPSADIACVKDWIAGL